MQRRPVVGLCAAALAGSWTQRARAQRSPLCVVRPQQTEGPYFVDEALRRSDIRGDPRSSVQSPGVPLRLSFSVSRVAGEDCAPLSGVLVDVWHCDARGRYSGVADSRSDARGQRFLRGQQLTDAQGLASFVTIYPGWYPGRAVHVHFKLRRDRSEFTSQLYFDDALTDVVHAQAPYARGEGRLRNEQDGLFARGGAQLLLSLRRSEDGYVGQFPIGLRA